LAIQIRVVLFSTTLSFIVVKSSLAKMLAKHEIKEIAKLAGLHFLAFCAVLDRQCHYG